MVRQPMSGESRTQVARIVSDAAEDAVRAPLLGMSLGLRAAYAALDAGATAIVFEGSAAAVADQARARGIAIRDEAPAGTSLVIRADALVSPELLKRLHPGEVVTDDDGVPVAGLLHVPSGQPALPALSRGRAHPFEEDTRLYAFVPKDDLTRRLAQRNLLRGLTKPQDGPASRHINRKVSTWVTARVVPFGVTPSMMTVVVALFGLAGGWFAASPLWGYQVLGAFLYQMHSILDGCDGEIARLTKNFGKHGALLDSVVDDVSNMLFFVGLSIGVHRSLDTAWPLWFGAVTAVGYVGITIIQFRKVLRETGTGFKATFWDTAKPRPLWYRMLHASLRRDVFILICFGLVLVGAAPGLVAIMPFAAVGTLAASLRRATQ
ncbi:MAG: CDP-alcohol phosphatidyltransferase family protein [Deltaproteobacteria bacterium]|nr:MAG: CDP-alcohol phosphatidyltransferase family protein [Deltaproteobacteria bacterium]